MIPHIKVNYIYFYAFLKKINLHYPFTVSSEKAWLINWLQVSLTHSKAHLLAAQWDAAKNPQQGNNRCNVLRAQYTHCTVSLYETFSGSDSSNVASQQFGLSKDTFRWTFQWAKINFNRLKILIFLVNNQETFPVGEQANQSLWEEVRVTHRGDLMRFTVHYTAFCHPLYI